MQRNTCDSLAWLSFDLFAEFRKLVHGVFLRHGGCSSGCFHSLNLGNIQGDLPENVTSNRKLALDILNLKFCCELFQCHSNQVITANIHKKENGDALTTNQCHLGLIILHADCQAAIFYDPVNHALSNVHCGWKGNVQNIYKHTIEKMHALYGSKPENILVGIAPSLGPNASEFINYRDELPGQFYPFQFKPNHFDFWQISHWQLLQSGILSHHIEIAEICTYTHSEDFFSYRRSKVCGRHGTIAALLS